MRNRVLIQGIGLCIAGATAAENRLWIEGGEVFPGDPEVRLGLRATHDDPLHAFSVAFRYDEAAFEFLEGQTEICLGSGRVEIDGDRLFALVQAYAPGPIAEGRFETHQRYADIQYVIKGREMIGSAPAGELEVEAPYDQEKDVEFHTLPEAFSQLALSDGCFAVLYPEDAHMPGRRLDCDDQVCKIVVKVLLP